MRIGTSLQSNPVDGSLDDVFAHVVVVATFVRHHRSGLVEHRWFVLTGFRAENSIKTFESQAGRPTIERPRQRLLVRRCDMPLAERTGGVSVLTKDLHERCRLLRNDAVITRKCTGAFGNVAHVHRMVVATGEHCCTSRRTQRRGVELIETQTIRRNTIECRSGNRSPERAAGSKADVVKKYQDDVWRVG